MTTQAEQFSERFNNDGTNWIDVNDEEFDKALYDSDGKVQYGHICWHPDTGVWASVVPREEHIIGEPVRFEFPDGSAIVVSGDAWAIEGDEPFSWRDA